MSLLRKPLPAAFRINSSGQFFQDIRLQLENDFMKSLEAEANNDNETEPIRPLPWYPDNLAWHLNFSRMQLRKNQALERFHEFLKQENEVGNITRQEAVSMVPPLFLDVLPHHHILDMCAAPGSKTFQLLEIIHQSKEPGLLPDGLVIANDVDVQRCNLLIHQTKRMCSANLIVTNHEAQFFPNCSLLKGSVKASKEGQEGVGKCVMQFDRVLCDVPCSGDGTLRKAPDIWRKWNAGLGNGVHRLQVEIAMRGIALLKMGGRMVYSTCSMNPVENEAVVAEVLRRSEGSVELLDVSSELPELVRRPGLKTWKVRDRGLWLASYKNVPKYRRSVITPSMFPSDESCNEGGISGDGMLENSMALDTEVGAENISGPATQPPSDKEHERSGDSLEHLENPGDDCKVAGQIEEISNESASTEGTEDDCNVKVSRFPLERCMRIVPHDQNSGAFFIAVLQKVSSLPEYHKNQSINSVQNIPANICGSIKEEKQPEMTPSEDVSHGQQSIVAEGASDASLMDDPLLAKEVYCSTAASIDTGLEDIEEKEVKECDNGEKRQAGPKGTRGKLLTQGKWKGVDPVVFFKDEATINSIRSFYGISDSFPLDDHLVTRNDDANHVKRIYYISKSVRDTLHLNFQAGQRLKITSLGLKIFERQGSKEASSPCLFRLSSEGLPLLLPYINKQILSASMADFRHLLQYRTIKFADFVEPGFGKKVEELMLGCCVVILGEGKQSTGPIQVDSSTIAIVCWKGRTNLCIMVSQQDSQELLERLSARFGCERSTCRDEEKDGEFMIDAADNPEGEELGDSYAGGEKLHESEAAIDESSVP